MVRACVQEGGGRLEAVDAHLHLNEAMQHRTAAAADELSNQTQVIFAKKFLTI